MSMDNSCYKENNENNLDQNKIHMKKLYMFKASKKIHDFCKCPSGKI